MTESPRKMVPLTEDEIAFMKAYMPSGSFGARLLERVFAELATLRERVKELEADRLIMSGELALAGIGVDAPALKVQLLKDTTAKLMAAEAHAVSQATELATLRNALGGIVQWPLPR